MTLNLVSLVRVLCVLSLLGNCDADNCGLKTSASDCPCPDDMIRKQLDQSYFCDYCEAGKFRTSTTECTDCVAGKWSPDTGSTSSTTCQKCLAGKYHDNVGQTSFTSCLVCSEGSVTLTSPSNSEYVSVDGASVCVHCPTGKFWTAKNNGVSECLDCQEGEYQDNEEATTCKSCPHNEYSGVAADEESKQGATECSACEAGKFLSIEDKKCESCSKGKYSPSSGATSCTTCEKGKFAANPGLDTCTSCDDGMEPNQSKDGCEPCSIGEYSNATTTNTCEKCHENTFANVTALGKCFDCQQSWGAGVGSNRCFRCYHGDLETQDSVKYSGDNICACPHNYTSVSGNQSATKQTFDAEFTEYKEHSHGFYESD